MTAPVAGRDVAALRVWPVAAAAFAVWVLAVLVNLPLKLDHDESYFLASGRILNQGSRLYADWMDFNTTAPSSVGRYSAWLASVLGTPLDITHKWTILLLALAGVGIAFAVLLPVLRKPGAARWVFGAGLPFVLLFATPEFGRREQMLCLGVAGWAASIALAAYGVKRSSPVALLAGLAAGLALYEKPHFALFGLALGLVDLIRVKGRIDRLLISTWVAAAVSASLYLWLILANPDFLPVILPATVDLYGPLGIGWQDTAVLLLKGAGLPVATVVLAAIALSRQAESRPPWIVFALAAAFVAAAAIIYVQQGLGFEYHRLPLDVALSVICLGLLAWGLDDGRISVSRPFHLGGVAAAALLLATAMGSRIEYFTRYPHRETITQSALLEAMRPPQKGDPILVIATDLYPIADAVTHLDVRWSSDFMSFFPIATLIRQDGRDGLRKPLPEAKRQYWTRWFRDRVAQKFCAQPPIRVLVETSEHPTFFQNDGFDMLAWLREDLAFDKCWTAARLIPVGEPVVFQRYRYQPYAAS
jgi:hypothetical protein